MFQISSATDEFAHIFSDQITLFKMANKNSNINKKSSHTSILLPPPVALLLYGLTSIPAWISNYIHYNVWNEITYPFLNFNGVTVEV